MQAIPGLVQQSIGAADMHTVVLAQLIIDPSFTGTIGTATEPGGYWQIGATLITFLPLPPQPPQPLGSGRIKLDIGSTATTINIASSAQIATDQGLEPIRLLGSAIASINVTAGIVGLATSAPGETSTVTAVNVTGGAIVNCGPGVTWTTATAAAGNGGASTLTLNSGGGMTLTTSSGATATVNGTTAVTTVNAGGQTYLNIRSGGTDHTTLNILNGGLASFANDPRTSTITTINFYLGGQLVTDPAVAAQVLFTNFNRVGSGVLISA